jgi:hypothetical protein
METALSIARPGSMVGDVGVPHGVELPIGEMFFRNKGVHGGSAPARSYIPDLLETSWRASIPDASWITRLTCGRVREPDPLPRRDDRLLVLHHQYLQTAHGYSPLQAGLAFR